MAKRKVSKKATKPKKKSRSGQKSVVENGKYSDSFIKNEKFQLISLFSILIITALSAVRFPYIYEIETAFFHLLRLPLLDFPSLIQYKFFFPDYFFMNILLAIVSAAIIFAKLNNPDGNHVKNKISGFSLAVTGVIAIHIVLAVMVFMNKGLYIQPFLLISEISILVFLFVKKDRENKIIISEKGLLDTNEKIVLGVFSVLVLILYSFDLMSWKYSFIGDEYAFYKYIEDFFTGFQTLAIFEERGVYEYNPQLATIYQAIVTFVFGKGIWGWKFSSAIIVPLTIIPLYIWVKMIFNRKTAIITTAAFALCHTMLAFGHIGYNNIQIIFTFVLAFLSFEITLRKNSSLWSLVTALVIGLGFYNYYFIRLLVVFIPFYWLLHPQRKNLSKFNITLMVSVVGALIVFAVFNSPMLAEIVGRSVVGGPRFGDGAEKPVYILLNFISSFFAFIYKSRDTHYVVGSVMDPVTAVGVLMGLAWAFSAFKKDWRAKFFITVYFVSVFVTGGIAEDKFPPVTRLQFLIPQLAVFAGTGYYYLLSGMSKLSKKENFIRPALYIIAALILVLNVYRFYVVMPKEFRFTVEENVTRYIMQKTADKEVVLVAEKMPEYDNIARYYGFIKRFRMIKPSDVEAMLNDDRLRGKVLIHTYRSKPASRIIDYAKDGDFIRDFRGGIAVMGYDFSDEAYYKGYKDLYFNGQTDYVVVHAPFELERYTKNRVRWLDERRERLERKKEKRDKKKREQEPDPEIQDTRILTQLQVTPVETFKECGEPAQIRTEAVDVKSAVVLEMEINLAAPSDMAISNDGKRIFIADGIDKKIICYTRKSDRVYGVERVIQAGGRKGLITAYGGEKAGEYYIEYDEENDVLMLLDSAYGAVHKISADGEYMGNILNGVFLNGARCIEMLSDRSGFAVVSPGQNTILEFDRGGSITKVYKTSHGNRCGEFSQPCFAAYGRGIYVLDAGNSRIQILNRNYSYKKQFATGRISTVSGPQAAVYENVKEPFVAVTTQYNRMLSLFYTKKNVIKEIDLKNIRGINMLNPAPLAKDKDGIIYILDLKAKNIVRVELLPELLKTM